MTNRRRLLMSACSGLLSLCAWPELGRTKPNYPLRPIRLVVPFVPGGVVDVTARLWADKMTGLLGTIVPENRGGASGMIGAREVANANADGYTLLFGNTSTQLLQPLIAPNPDFDPRQSFAPISIFVNSAIAIVVNPTVPAKRLDELIAYIKNRSEQTTYGSPGTRTLTNVAGELLKRLANLPHFVHVPYKGGGQSVVDLIGGHISVLMIAITPEILELHRTGKARIIATFNAEPLSFAPELGRVCEYIPDLIVTLWMGVFAPARTPTDVLAIVGGAQRKLRTDEAFKKRLEDAGFEPILNGPEEAQQFLDKDYGRLASLIHRTGLTLE